MSSSTPWCFYVRAGVAIAQEGRPTSGDFKQGKAALTATLAGPSDKVFENALMLQFGKGHFDAKQRK
jgi:hypothetical protein